MTERVSNPEKQEGELYYRLRRQLATDGKAETKGMQGVLDEAKADFPVLFFYVESHFTDAFVWFR